jgi:hypothetical protein
MNAVLPQKPSDPAAVKRARLQLLREFVHETCNFIMLNAEAVQIAAEQGDDTGLNYNLRRLCIYAKAAAKTADEIEEIKNGGGP